MVIKKTGRKVRKIRKALAPGADNAGARALPKFDLREALRRDVTSAHKRIDRLHSRGERLRANYRKDLKIRWLKLAEQTGMGAALEDYRQAAARAALINRLYNVVAKRQKLEICERHLLAFIQKNVADDHLDKKTMEASLKLCRALFRYLHVEQTREKDAAVRRAWKRLGALLKTSAAANAFLFEIP